MPPSSKDQTGAGISGTAPGEEPADLAAQAAVAEPAAPPAEPALDPKERAKELARERARDRKRRRRERRSARRARLSGLGTRLRDLPSRRRARREARPRVKRLRFASVFLGLALLAVVSWIFGILMAVAQDLPDLEARSQYEQAENSVVYAADGKTQLTTLTGNERRILLDSSEIAPLLKQAVVAIEDQRFYEHRGIDYLGIARALEQDVLAGGAVQGGSTITQQFVKNALEAQGSRTMLQKLREAALAYQIERQWSKDKILTNYMNNIYFGNGAYGVEAAARTYFGWNHPGCGPKGDRCASVLRPEEAAMLAALISSPTAYDPGANPESATTQRNVVLQKMREQGVLEISDDDFDSLLATPVPRKRDIEPPTEESDAPYFTAWLRQQIVDKYGAGRAFGGGLRIRSTLDADLQEAAENAVSSRLGGLGPTAAVVALDNGSAEVLAMVGGQDYEQSAFNLATNGMRQPGSAFKPFTLVTALSEGHSPSEVYSSSPQRLPFTTTIKRPNGKRKKVQEVFKVSNYEDNYLGSASIATATTYSDNSVYAQLGLDVGLNDIVDTAHDLGITSRIDDNPAIILGGLKHGVSPLEMAYAYNTLANGGTRVSGTEASRGNGSGPVAIEKVTDAHGKPAPDAEGGSGVNEKVTKQVVDPGVAGQATDILHTVVTSGTGRNAQVGDDYIWGKTGTTDNNADAWFVGANEDITVAVWVGYPDGATPMTTEYNGGPVDGGTLPALIWRDIVSAWDDARASEESSADSTGEDPVTTTPAVPATPPPEEEPPVSEAPPEEEQPAPEEQPPPDGGGNTGAGPGSGQDGSSGGGTDGATGAGAPSG